MLKHFLLVDDCDNDFFLLQHAMKKSGVPAVLHRVTGVEEAIDYLEKGAANQIELPCAVLCDVRLENRTGCELVKWIRKQPSLKDMAILIWSGSKPTECCRLEDLDVEAVVSKPSNHTDFVAILDTLQRLCDERKTSRV